MRFNEIKGKTTLNPPSISVGDEVKVGKFKNRKAEVKGFTKDDHGQPVLKTTKGDQKLYKPRVTKLEPKEKLEEITKQEFKDTLKNPHRVLILKTIEAMNKKLTEMRTLQEYQFNKEHETHIVTVIYNNSYNSASDLKLIFNSYFPSDKFNTDIINETPRFNNHMTESTLYIMEQR